MGDFLTQRWAKIVIFGAGLLLDLLFHALALSLYFNFTSQNEHCYFVTFAPALLGVSLLFSLVPIPYFGVIHSENEKMQARQDTPEREGLVPPKVDGTKQASPSPAAKVQKDQSCCTLRSYMGKFSATLKSLAIFTMSLPYLFVPLVLGAYSAIRDSIREDQPYNASIWGAPEDVLKDTERLNSLNTMIRYLWFIIGSKLFVLFYGHFGYLYRTRGLTGNSLNQNA